MPWAPCVPRTPHAPTPFPPRDLTLSPRRLIPAYVVHPYLLLCRCERRGVFPQERGVASRPALDYRYGIPYFTEMGGQAARCAKLALRSYVITSSFNYLELCESPFLLPQRRVGSDCYVTPCRAFHLYV